MQAADIEHHHQLTVTAVDQELVLGVTATQPELAPRRQRREQQDVVEHRGHRDTCIHQDSNIKLKPATRKARGRLEPLMTHTGDR